MPIYNEERFLDSSLTSLRQQDYPNLEIVISDNASTDRTVPKSARVPCSRGSAHPHRAFRHRKCEESTPTSSARWRWRKARTSCGRRGTTWWTPNLISECVGLLGKPMREPASLLAVPAGSAQRMSRCRAVRAGPDTLRGLTPIARLFTIFWGQHAPGRRPDPDRAVARVPAAGQCDRWRPCASGRPRAAWGFPARRHRPYGRGANSGSS